MAALHMSPKIKLAVVLASAATCVLAVWGVRWVIRARSQSAYSSCINGLRQIDGAVEQWALDNHKTTNDTPTWAEIVGRNRYLREKPKCPQGGTYTLSRVGDYPRCSIPMHSFYFGMVAVVDESGAPVQSAYVSVEGVTMSGEPALTDTNGHAMVGHWPGITVDDWSHGRSSITASMTGYETGRVTLPSGWPVIITIKREHK
jgi:hypothetical protein